MDPGHSYVECIGNHISLTAKFQEKGSQGWAVVSVGQVMVIQALEPAFSPQFSC